ncbi:MAG: ATP-dependent DNA helicase RecG [Actinomycetota bacterium]|nr:ATP-dependent DNA helicase RecG [Actinomycetota bacterium]
MVKRSFTYLSDINLDTLNGLGDKRYSLLKRNDLFSITDLLRFFPKKHIDRSSVKLIEEITNNDINSEVTVIAYIKKVSVFTTRSRLRITTLIITDDTGVINAKWFGPQYIESRFKEGERVAISGKPEIKKSGTVEYKNPTIEKFDDLEDLNETGSLIPVYNKLEGITSSSIRKALKQVFNIISTKKEDLEPGIEDVLPDIILKNFNLLNRLDSLKGIHFPQDKNEYYASRRRLAIDEFIYLRVIFESLKKNYKKQSKGFSYKVKIDEVENYIGNLPFSLTNSQKKAAFEIFDDLKNDYPMKRLLQGEVGSGKTVVASIAIYSAVQSGYQVALMAPTEVLCEQHFKSLNSFLGKSGIKQYLLTSSTKEREIIDRKIKEGEPGLYIGTHALIQEKIKFKNLGLAIIDEQQRFGVDQRKKLITNENTIPDQLVMTATPIPRTTALSIYGDLDITTINELPPGRKKIESHLFNGLESDNLKVFEKCKEHLDKKSQIFVVCPFIEESENSDIQAAEVVFQEYTEKFTKYNVELLHGRMSNEDKEEIMKKMTRGEIDILISTVVIEVGIDISNATLMVIESAERFGLNQLHQLRGRVGRGNKQSECIFHITKKKSLTTISDDGRKRLEAIVLLDDGFKLSEIDLEIRGEGKVTGTSQSGKSDLKVANLRFDYDLLSESKYIFDSINDEKIKSKILKEAEMFFPNYFKVESST